MRYFLIFWAMPLGLFWGWYFLSLNDMHFGTIYLSRVLHDAVFELYGKLAGMDPASIPGLIAKACIVDTALIGAILAYRRRSRIAAWWREWQETRRPYAEESPADNS